MAGMSSGAIGSAAGTAVGAAVGSVIPGIGTVLGGMLGGSAGGLFGGLFGGKKAPKQVIPAPFTQQYVPLSMVKSSNPDWGMQFDPEHFVDRFTGDTLRVSNKGEYKKTGSIYNWAEGDRNRVLAFLNGADDTPVPGSDAAEKLKAEAAQKEAEVLQKRLSS